MRSHHYDALHLFVGVAQYKSLSAAAEQFHLTKGALSHQIKRLEDELGFSVFTRHARGIELSPKGRELLAVAGPVFQRLDNAIAGIASEVEQSLTIGVTTYFASRWLSPRLTGFMQAYPDIRLRIQPMIDPLNFAGEEVDLAIRWGNGKWSDCSVVTLMHCPAWPSGDLRAYDLVNDVGMDSAISQLTLLRDRKDSSAWSEWFELAGLGIEARMDTLIIADPNVRVQAVLDGQGIALNDALVSAEIESQRMYRLSDIELSDYGYHLTYEERALENVAVESFVQWIREVADDSQ